MIIKQNKATGGFYTICKKNGEYFFADFSDVPLSGPECFIFHCNEDGKVTDWNEVYGVRFDTMDIENMLETVNTFLNE